ncbi:MAG: hypothetical protein ACE5H1_10180 [Thermodesulfobacteriota bacterium]
MTQFIKYTSNLIEYKSVPNFLTTVNTFVDLPGSSWPVRNFKTKHLYFTATTNNLSVQVLASIDGGTTFGITTISTFTVTVGTPLLKTISTWYTDIKVQVKPAVADSHGTLATLIAGGPL